MNIHSIKSRFLGSYGLLILLFMIQLPILYVMVGGMAKKYAQVETAGEMRKLAIEVNYLLNRHIMNGEEELEAVFQAKKAEFGKRVEALRSGSADVPAVSGSAALEKLGTVEKKWDGMKAALNEAMASGDKLSESMIELEKTTYPMVDRLNDLVRSFVALKDPSYSKSIDLSGLLRMRTVNLSYLMERYSRTNYDHSEIAGNLEKTVGEFSEALSGLKNGSAALGLKPAGPAFSSKFSDIEEVWGKRRDLVSRGIKNKDEFAARGRDLSENFTPQMVAACDDLTGVIASNARAGAMKSIVIMALTIVLSILIALFFMWATNQHLIKPMMAIKETVEAYSEGDLNRRSNIRIHFFGHDIKDEIVDLSQSVDAMGSQVSEVIGKITDSSNFLASASEQLSASSTQIAEGANRQSSQTVQIATAMEEMSATVIEVAKNSMSASDSAKEAQKIALDSGMVVEQAVSAMQEVSEATSVTADTIKKLGKSSEEIGTIVSVINDIADQTNLLALNAAIEAARAGEQGRGFAVVADEVRKLAERTTKATKEISGMIGAIQSETNKAVEAMSEGTRKVENGVNLANQAGDALKQIVTGVESVCEMITHIATSAEEQSSTADDISRNMDSIADVAKSNVSAIGEAANATNEMARLAGELKELVSRFKAGGNAVQPSVREAEVRKFPGGRLKTLKASGSLA